MGLKNWNDVAELAAIDMDAREGITHFDKLNKLSGEVEIGDGFEKVDTEADPAHCAVEADEDPDLRHVADFYIRNDWSPSGALDEAAKRETAEDPYADAA